ncbi:MAG: hypothetical protein R3Y07_08555 [Eubacteriales bacterium]
MKDLRVSIRLTPEEHEEFKIFSLKQKKSMNQILLDYIRELIKKEKNHE